MQIVGKLQRLVKAIENGDIERVCRGFQPLEILLEFVPTVCTVGHKYAAAFDGYSNSC